MRTALPQPSARGTVGEAHRLPTLPPLPPVCFCSPVGYSCDGTSQTACNADSYNQYVGATSCSACSGCRGICTGNDYTTCSGGTCTGMTSSSGADYCTLPWFNTTCGDGGCPLQQGGAMRPVTVAWSPPMHPSGRHQPHRAPHLQGLSTTLPCASASPAPRARLAPAAHALLGELGVVRGEGICHCAGKGICQCAAACPLLCQLA
jgi:hypothetical protein